MKNKLQFVIKLVSAKIKNHLNLVLFINVSLAVLGFVVANPSCSRVEFVPAHLAETSPGLAGHVVETAGVTCTANQYQDNNGQCVTCRLDQTWDSGSSVCGCPVGRQEYDKKCVDKCADGTQMDAQGSCQLSCRPDQVVVGNRCACSPGVTEYKGVCQNCNTSSGRSNKFCSCDPEHFDIVNNNCLPKCSDDQTRDMAGACQNSCKSTLTAIAYADGQCWQEPATPVISNQSCPPGQAGGIKNTQAQVASLSCSKGLIVSAGLVNSGDPIIKNSCLPLECSPGKVSKDGVCSCDLNKSELLKDGSCVLKCNAGQTRGYDEICRKGCTDISTGNTYQSGQTWHSPAAPTVSSRACPAGDSGSITTSQPRVTNFICNDGVIVTSEVTDTGVPTSKSSCFCDLATSEFLCTGVCAPKCSPSQARDSDGICQEKCNDNGKTYASGSQWQSPATPIVTTAACPADSTGSISSSQGQVSNLSCLKGSVSNNGIVPIGNPVITNNCSKITCPANEQFSGGACSCDITNFDLLGSGVCSAKCALGQTRDSNYECVSGCTDVTTGAHYKNGEVWQIAGIPGTAVEACPAGQTGAINVSQPTLQAFSCANGKTVTGSLSNNGVGIRTNNCVTPPVYYNSWCNDACDGRNAKWSGFNEKSNLPLCGGYDYNTNTYLSRPDGGFVNGIGVLAPHDNDGHSLVCFSSTSPISPALCQPGLGHCSEQPWKRH